MQRLAHTARPRAIVLPWRAAYAFANTSTGRISQRSISFGRSSRFRYQGQNWISTPRLTLVGGTDSDRDDSMGSAVGIARRGIIMWAFRGGAVFIVALGAYVSVEVMRRLPYFQKMRIRQRIELPEIKRLYLTAKELELDETRELWLYRPLKEVFLRSVFDSDPSGPLLLTGPDGSGKSGLLKQVLTNRRNTLYLDLREKPVLDGNELLATFVERTGYLMRPQELLGRAIFERAAGGGRAGRGDEDAEVALSMITDVLKQMKLERETKRRRRALAVREAQMGDLGLGLVTGDEAMKGMHVHAGGSQAGDYGVSSPFSSSVIPPNDGGYAERILLWVLRRYAGYPYRQERLFRWYAAMFGAGAATRAVHRASNQAMQALGAAEQYAATARSSAGSDPLAWSDEMPVLALDELHYVNSRYAADADMRRLLDWALFLTDTRLAHVVLSCPIDLAEQLDYHPGFHVRRVRLYIDYARTYSLKDYFSGPVRRFLEARAGIQYSTSSSNTTSQAGKADPSVSFGVSNAPGNRDAASKVAEELHQTGTNGGGRVSASAASHGTVTSGVLGSYSALRLWREARGLSWDLDSEFSGGDALFLRSNSFRFRPVHAPPEVRTRLGIGFQGFGGSKSSLQSQSTKKTEGSSIASSTGTEIRQSYSYLYPYAGEGISRTGEGGKSPSDALTPGTPPILPPTVHGSWESTAHPLRRAVLLNDRECESIINIVGGNMKDVDTVVQAVASGHAWSSVVARLVADSVELVEALLEDVLEGTIAGGAGDSGKAHGGTAGGLGGDGHSTPSAMARSERWIRRRATSRTPVRALWRTAGRVDGTDLRGPGGGPLAFLYFLRLFALLEDLSARKYVSRRDLTSGAFAGCGWELDSYVDAGVLICANLRSSVKLVAQTAPGGTNQSQGYSSPGGAQGKPPSSTAAFGIPIAAPMLSAGTNASTIASSYSDVPASGPGRFIGAASPRMRVAFRAVVQSRELYALRDRVQRDVLSGAALERVRELEGALSDARIERDYWLKEMGAAWSGESFEEMGMGEGVDGANDDDDDQDQDEGMGVLYRLRTCEVTVRGLLDEKMALQSGVWDGLTLPDDPWGEGLEEDGGIYGHGGGVAHGVLKGKSSFAGGSGIGRSKRGGAGGRGGHQGHGAETAAVGGRADATAGGGMGHE